MALTKPETMFKATMISQMRKAGGYARRLEDQFAVGIPDCILIPAGGPVFFVEAKIIRSPKWGPSPRQKLELDRINSTNAAYGIVAGLDKSGALVIRYNSVRLFFTVPWNIDQALKGFLSHVR